jgi:hypothetical protein
VLLCDVLADDLEGTIVVEVAVLLVAVLFNLVPKLLKVAIIFLVEVDAGCAVSELENLI